MHFFLCTELPQKATTVLKEIEEKISRLSSSLSALQLLEWPHAIRQLSTNPVEELQKFASLYATLYKTVVSEFYK